jgi:predicted Ser/Thr protein kinase
MPDNAQLHDLFKRWCLLHDQGRPLPPEQICSDRPELLLPLREKIDAYLLLKKMPYSPESPTDAATRPDTPRHSGSTQRSASAPWFFAGYLIERVLGRGGMGVVYQARHPQLELTVALKTMRGEAESAEGAERFLREARAVALLNHPHIVRLFDAGFADGSHYFTMALVTGGSLKDHRKALAGDPRRAAALMEKVARGVQHAHDYGIIHRDLKPGNILVDDHGEPLVSDFGLAKFLDSSDQLTASGSMLGTVPFMAPEQLSGPNKQASTKTDVWALGVILYELLTSRRPFVGEETVELVQQIVNAEPPRPRSLNPAVDAALETIVLKCLEKVPAQRYGSAQEVADDLARWLRGERIGARPLSWPRRLARQVKRRPTLHALGLSAVLGAALFAAQAWTTPEPTSQDPAAVLRELEAHLKHGRKVDLMGAMGPPRWFRWFDWEHGLGFAFTAKDGVWQLDARSIALVELMPQPPCDHYRFAAELSHEEGTQDAAVGLYVGGEESPAGSGDYYFLDVSFADMGFFAGEGRIQLYSLKQRLKTGTFDSLPKWRFSVPQSALPLLGASTVGLLGSPFGPRPVLASSALCPARPPARARIWHHFAVDVHPDNIVVRFDDMPQRMVTRDQLMTSVRYWFLSRKQALNPAPSFGPRHACGIYLRAAVVAVRNVSITPLDP